MNEIDVNRCQYHNSTGKCKIPHFENNIKFTSCNCEEWNCYYKQLQQLKKENKELKEDLDTVDDFVSDVSIYLRYDEGYPDNLDEVEACIEGLSKECTELKKENKILKEKLLPILEFYANTYIGVPQTDGTYRINLTAPSITGECITVYDPRPAKEGVELIKRVVE